MNFPLERLFERAAHIPMHRCCQFAIIVIIIIIIIVVVVVVVFTIRFIIKII